MLANKDIDKILNRFGLKTKEYDNFYLALTHSTYANEHHLESNERIEFLGDAVLGLLTAEYIYKNFPLLAEGEMTKLRAIYVCEDANLSYAKELTLDQLLLLGNGEEQSGGRKKPAVIADTFECFLGAVYLSCGIGAVKKILEQIVFPHIKAIDNQQFIDYKTKLQEYVQSETKNTLKYEVINEVGKPNDKIFTMNAILDGIVLGTGKGKSKKEASQEAAKDALSKLAI